ncbi:MAG: peptidylprolyl isomerase [Porphyromonas sp.]|nr:peptidylprolyl isomerase [Porphyromonas sp.]
MQTKIRSYILLLSTLLLLAPTEMEAQRKSNVIDEVAWVVGDEAILLSDIERQRLYYESMGQHFSDDARCAIPEQMAIQKLFLNQAVIDSVYPNEAMVTQATNSWLEQVTNQLGGRDKLEEYLGRNYTQIREERRKIIAEEYTMMQMQQKLVGEVKVTPSEVNRFYEKVNKDSLPFIPLTVETQIITARPKMSVSEVDAIKERLLQFTNDIQEGKSDFSTLATIYSQDQATALRGGEIGFVGRAELEPEFANVAFNLNDPEKVSRIVRTARGYHIMQLIDKRGDLVNVRHILLRPEVSAEELAEATNRLDSIRHHIVTDSLPFGIAARLYSQDENTRLGNGQMVNNRQQSQHNGTASFAMEDLPQEVSATVAKLEEGEISSPFVMRDENGNTIVALVRLKRRNPGHRANVVDDYQVIKEIVTQKKQGELIDEWIREKQKTTYVRISPEYKQCKFQYPGWGEQE